MLRSSIQQRSSVAATLVAKAATTAVGSHFLPASRATTAINTETSAPVLGNLHCRWQSTKPAAPPTPKSAIWPLAPPSQTSRPLVDPVKIPSVGGLRINQMKEENKHINLVRYEHKNRTWTVHHVDYFSEAMAIGFLDAGLLPGDVVLSCMPEHWSETMVLQFACSKAGMTLYQFDCSIAKSDPVGYKETLKQALIASKANVFCSPETHDDVNYIDLDKEVIPELNFFDTDEGMPFISPRYPHLRFCLQTGFEDEEKEGFFRLAHFLVPAGTVEEWLQNAEREPTTTLPLTPIAPSTPLMGTFQYDDKGIPVATGPPLSNEQVIAQGAWDTYCKILKKEYHEVHGVGVVW